MIKLGKCVLGTYTLRTPQGHLQLENWTVDNYFAGNSTDIEHVKLIKQAYSIYPTPV